MDYKFFGRQCMITNRNKYVNRIAMKILRNQSVFIVAELSGNHGQNFADAVRMIEEAKRAGADAVKLQMYRPETITFSSDAKWFRIGEGTSWSGETLFSLYSRSYTPWEWFPKLQKVAHDFELDFFASVFDETAVDELEKIGVPAYKIASFEIVDIPLLKKVASTGKPVILSTGMATLGEIEEAVSTLRSHGCEDIILLKCTSAYPAPPEEMNLRTIPHLAQAFDCPVGLSDHTKGIEVPVTAVALGVVLIEKHFTLSRADGGPESDFALEPDEFQQMVQAVRTAEKALGRVHYGRTEHEKPSLIFRRSLFVIKDMKVGDQFTSENIRSIRPGYGLHPRYYEKVLGKRARKNIRAGTPLSWDMIEV